MKKAIESKEPNAVLADNSLMPFGKYKGFQMANVPASYLIWLYDNDKCSAEVQEYIEDNMDVLNKEITDNDKCSAEVQEYIEDNMDVLNKEITDNEYKF